MGYLEHPEGAAITAAWLDEASWETDIGVVELRCRPRCGRGTTRIISVRTCRTEPTFRSGSDRRYGPSVRRLPLLTVVAIASLVSACTRATRRPAAGECRPRRETRPDPTTPTTSRRQPSPRQQCLEVFDFTGAIAIGGLPGW